MPGQGGEHPEQLYDPPSHEPLVDRPWDPEQVRRGIRAIAADAEAAFDSRGWRAHPRDGAGGEQLEWASTVYLGGAGVVDALHRLAGRGLIEPARSYVPYLDRPYRPDFPDADHERSLWMGETGIRLVLQRIAPSAANADRLAVLIGANARDERRELMWGSPGTMLAAGAMHELTGEPRWLDLWRRSAAWLRDQCDPETGLWTQRLYGQVTRWIGPAHGFAGCVLALSADAGDDQQRQAAAVVRRLAVERDGLANWPPRAEGGLGRGGASTRVQWCHGAPGIVASLAEIAPGDGEHERLLLAGGELTWQAGPLVKGANLCHGTAGNGHAFLALFRRTGDELWLARARAFAMHALAQVERDRAAFGFGHYSLWTGDLGAALYLADCLDGRCRLPLP
ncbi:MAG TPA: LanC-like protein [Gaiellales bacterium]|nr:LanC-like protein [Gaiellales bacterium]